MFRTAGGVWYPSTNELKHPVGSEFSDSLNNILSDKDFKKKFGDLTRNENEMLKKHQNIETNHPTIENLKLKKFHGFQKIDDNLFTIIISIKLLLKN